MRFRWFGRLARTLIDCSREGAPESVRASSDSYRKSDFDFVTLPNPLNLADFCGFAVAAR
jgi:hypothetical protein